MLSCAGNSAAQAQSPTWSSTGFHQQPASLHSQGVLTRKFTNQINYRSSGEESRKIHPKKSTYLVCHGCLCCAAKQVSNISAIHTNIRHNSPFQPSAFTSLLLAPYQRQPSCSVGQAVGFVPCKAGPSRAVYPERSYIAALLQYSAPAVQC